MQKVPFLDEAKFRFTEGELPPFWKKIRAAGLSMITAGTGFAIVPGGLLAGGLVAAFGLGATLAAQFATKYGAAQVKEKVSDKILEKKAEQAVKDSTKTQQ